MTTAAKRTPRKAREKRGQGRPVVGQNEVGQERLLAAAEKLLRELPPARVTMARIAQEAEVDPALVRYYFGNRTALLLAVADRMTHHDASHAARSDPAAVVSLADHIRLTLKFTRSAPFIRRLMIEELAGAGNEESRARVRSMNLDLISFYRRVLKADASQAAQRVNPLFLHLLVLGATDFFATAEPLIREMVPGNTNMERLATGYQEFLVKIVTDGLRMA